MQFPALYKNPMQMYKMIKNQLGVVQKRFSTSILVHCIGFLYIRGKLHVTGQQSYISWGDLTILILRVDVDHYSVSHGTFEKLW